MAEQQSAAHRFIMQLLTSELAAPLPDRAIAAFAAHIVEGARPLGVLFYGSGLRKDDPDGILDFYVVVEHYRDWTHGLRARTANRILPPNVEYYEMTREGRVMRAKVAVISRAHFLRGTGRHSLDTTLWARFCQPCRMVWVRDPAAADQILRCILRAVHTAVWWAAILGPRSGTPEQFWTALFTKTYGAELRVESALRPEQLLEGPVLRRYQALLYYGWQAAGISLARCGGRITPHLAPAERRKWLEKWELRRKAGPVLNGVRLGKAAFTFRGGARYIAWKIHRHTGVELPLTPFAERHPLLSAPRLLWKIRGKGVLRPRR